MKTKARNEPEAGPLEQIRAEAAVWLARLHSDTRSELTDSSFRAWLAEDPMHAAAFERLTNIWEATGSLRSLRNVVAIPIRGAGNRTMSGRINWYLIDQDGLPYH